MGKEGLNDLLDFRDAKVNIFTFLAAVFILIVSAYFVYAVIDSAVVSGINMSCPSNNTNFSIFGTNNVQINCSAFVTNDSLYIANVTMNITIAENSVVVASNSTNNTGAFVNYSNRIIQFNFTLPEGFYRANCTARANRSDAGSFDALQMINFTSNVTFKVDLSSPIIHAGESNKLSFRDTTAANANR